MSLPAPLGKPVKPGKDPRRQAGQGQALPLQAYTVTSAVESRIKPSHSVRKTLSDHPSAVYKSERAHFIRIT